MTQTPRTCARFFRASALAPPPEGAQGPLRSAKLAPELQKGESFKELEELQRSDSIYPDDGPVSQAADL